MTDATQQSHRRFPLLAVALGLAIFVVFAVAAYAYASPYLVLDRLKRAADARDAVTVNRYVDYPALRVSLKQQVTEMLARRLDKQKRENPLAAIGALVGIALIGPLVDAYATPEGVAALLNGMPPRGEPGEQPPEPTSPQAAESGQRDAGPAAAPPEQPSSSARPPRASAGYRGIDEFAVTYRRDATSRPYSVILLRSGWLSWRLAAVELNAQP